MRLITIFIFVVFIIGLTAMFFNGQRPDNLGVKNNRLSDCPASPNCVSSMTASKHHFIEPLAFQESSTVALKKLQKILEKQRGFKIISADENYLHVECKSLILGFIDDLEFYWNADTEVFHVRSASRLGHSDLGANRKRVEKISQLFNE